MSTVVMHAVTSLDGCIADENDEVGPLFDWYFNGEHPIIDEAGEQQHAPFRVSSRSLPYVRSMWADIRVSIQGRHLFDLFGGGKPYFGRSVGRRELDDPHVVIQGDRVLHLRYRARR